MNKINKSNEYPIKAVKRRRGRPPKLSNSNGTPVEYRDVKEKKAQKLLKAALKKVSVIMNSFVDKLL